MMKTPLSLLALLGCVFSLRVAKAQEAPALLSGGNTTSSAILQDSSPSAKSAAETQVARKPLHQNNAVWLDDSFVNKFASATKVAEFARDSKKSYFVKTWFVNCGSLSSEGRLRYYPEAVANVKAFLNAVKSAEKAEDTRFEVFAYLSGTLTTTDKYTIDLSNPTTRRNIISLSKKFTSATSEDSYVAGAGRTFDGVMIDMEPSGLDVERFGHLQTLMRELKSELGPGKKTGVAAHKHGNSTDVEWYWSDSFYHYMARNVDYIASMNYNSGTNTPEAYQQWMQTQTNRILRAVSGKVWNNDANHPAPTNGVKVFIGFPAYPEPEGRENGHLASAENTRYAALGTEAGLKGLDDSSLSYFQGAALYMQTDGTGAGGYANKATDWLWWKQNWLGLR